ncbi:MAG: alpha-glucan family phosphorylase [Methanosarcinaceae archaeon]|nr:alpha-glucan family phosphorylase [Methanosarcinaceae archaeon]MDF1533568.1 alpha-glucan family phosphorylase [Methanosarcinaceae archaeon]
MLQFDKGIDKKDRIIAYYSMEIGLDSRIPTYSGGLGVLAGDTIRSCADLGVPIVGITLLSERGYFYQKLDSDGNQIEMPVSWNKDNFLTLLPAKTTLHIEGRNVTVQVWQYTVTGVGGATVPVYLLDTNVEGNSEYDCAITSYLYGGDLQYRFAQEMVLGIAGVSILKELGYTGIRKYHMNEGHAALLTLELLERDKVDNNKPAYDPHNVRKMCVFTTHTPVPAGHDKFPHGIVRNMYGNISRFEMDDEIHTDGMLNMTLLALRMSRFINGVAKKHTEVSRSMFPGYSIDSITNGVHSPTWVCESFAKLYDKYMPGWRTDPFTLRYALSIPNPEIWDAHMVAKKRLIDKVNSLTNAGMDHDILTIGFARRATAYKRMELLFHDIENLVRINDNAGEIQIIFAGKAHPADLGGKETIRRIHTRIEELSGRIKIAYLPNYNMGLSRLMISGVDVWLNTPQRPMEASGTSGMKACHNGVLNLSVFDGWWLEGYIKDATGWGIGLKPTDAKEEIKTDNAADASDLYNKLEHEILPMFYDDKPKWMDMVCHSIALNASFFNTHRMIQQYITSAYCH